MKWFRLVLVIGTIALHASGFSALAAELPSVDPSACTIAPIDPPLPGVEGDLNAPSPTPSPIATEPAQPADAATEQAIIGRIAMSIACQNAGDLPRMTANFTPDWVASRFSGYDLAFTQRYLTAVASPQPIDAAERIELIAVEDVMIREDGVAIALVTTRQQGIEAISLLALVANGEDWLIESGQPLVTE